MKGQFCRNCRFWIDYMQGEGPEDVEGECVRFPPVLHDMSTSYDGEEVFNATSWVSPIMRGNQWCGEWKEAANDEG